MMRGLVLAAASLVAMSGVAFAADAPVQPNVFQWSGFYAGAHVGGTWLKGNMTAYTPYNSYSGFGVSGLNDGSFAGGVQLGYDHQVGNIVLGVAADATFMDINKSSSDDAPGTLFWRKLNWTATVTPRIGYAFDNIMIYGKGGLALGGFEVGHDQNGTNISSKKTQIGYVLGAGVEYAMARNWTMNLEYDYMNFGNDSIHVNGSPDISIEQGGDVHAVKLGLNYKF